MSALSAAPGNKYANTTRTGACETAQMGDSLTVTITGPETLWPPNHKLVPVSITATDTDGDEVMLATEGAHDQIVGGEEANGSGNTVDDVDPAMDSASGAGTATTEHGVRAERAGTVKDGRTYTLMYEASGGVDDTCEGSFSIFVPHDQRGGAGWKQ
ncbi:MAG: hypothetical protein ACRDJP_04425 [Actinomycetota bacterium]